MFLSASSDCPITSSPVQNFPNKKKKTRFVNVCCCNKCRLNLAIILEFINKSYLIKKTSTFN